MTDKQLHKLRRQDLLQLMLEQGREALALQTKLNEINSEYIQVNAQYERLKEKLDEKDTAIEKLKKRLDGKDAVIEKLKKRLDKKDARIAELEKELEAIRVDRVVRLEESGPIAELSNQLTGVFKEAQKAADQYLYHLQRICDHKVEEVVRKDAVQQETIREEAVQQETIRKDAVRQEAVRKDAVQQEAIQPESAISRLRREAARNREASDG